MVTTQPHTQINHHTYNISSEPFLKGSTLTSELYLCEGGVEGQALEDGIPALGAKIVPCGQKKHTKSMSYEVRMEELKRAGAMRQDGERWSSNRPMVPETDRDTHCRARAPSMSY